jgi:hypothetical protein
MSETPLNSKIARGFPIRWSHIVALYLAIIFAGFVRILPTSGQGLWVQAAEGQSILDDGFIPQTDRFASDEAKPASGWLGRVLLAKCLQIGANSSPDYALAAGVECWRSLHVVVVLIAFWSLFIAYRRRGNTPGIAALMCAIAIPILPMAFANLHTGIFGLACFAILLSAVGGNRLGIVDWLVVPATMIAWANLDMSFVVGLLFLFLKTLGEFVDRPRSWIWPGLFALTILAIFVGNPDGFSILAKWFAWTKLPALQDLSFWQTMNFFERRTMHWLVFGSLAILILASYLSKESLRPADMAIVVGLLALALWRQTFVAWWFFAVPWLVAPHWSTFVRRHWDFDADSSGSIPKAIAAFVAIFLLCAIVAPSKWINDGHPQSPDSTLAPDVPWRLHFSFVGDESKSLVSQLDSAIARSYPQGRFIGKILAFDTPREFLVFSKANRNRLLHDGDLTYYSIVRLRDHVSLSKAGPGWWETVDRNAVNAIVVNVNTQFELTEELKKDPDWIIIDGIGPTNMLGVALRRSPILPR